MLQQLLILITMVLAGTFISFWVRRFGMSGLEMWLPFGIITGYAISPLIGFIVAASILLLSWALFPFEMHFLVLMFVCLGIVLYLARFFPVTEANFAMQAIYLVLIYNVISNIILFFTGLDPFRIFRFILLSIMINWVVFAKLGWKILSALK